MFLFVNVFFVGFFFLYVRSGFRQSQKNKTSQPFVFQSSCFAPLASDCPSCLQSRGPSPCTVLSHSVLFVLQLSSGETMTLSLMHYAGFMHCHGSADLFICCGSFASTFVALNYKLRFPACVSVQIKIWVADSDPPSPHHHNHHPFTVIMLKFNAFLLLVL